MHDYWPTFKELGKENQETQSAKLNFIFPEGKSLALTFAASKETFPETRQNFLAALANHPELKSRLLKFWYAGEKIYEVYEIDRSPRGTAIRHVAPLKFADRTQQENRDWPFAINSEKAHFEILDESLITADFQVSWQRL
jgi:hypothetical protein